MIRVLGLSLAAAFALLVTLSAGEPGGRQGDGCFEAKRTNGWCRSSNVGYVAGIEIKSRNLWETLDAHGHDIDPARLKCAGCRAAFTKDGFCSRCRMGFVRKQAYLSKLTYWIARGTLIDPARIDCKTCRKNVTNSGWCEKCGVGIVDGRLALRNRQSVEDARQAFATLHAAIRTLERCERCAVATFANGRCRKCNISYRDGKPAAGATKNGRK